MFSKFIGSRCEYSSKTTLVICKLKKSGQSYYEIAYYLEIPKFFVLIIFYLKAKKLDNPFKSSKQLRRPPKLDFRAQQAIICYIKKFLYNNLYVLSTFSKSGHIINQITIQQYLKAADFF